MWHADLLAQMSVAVDNLRPALLSRSTFLLLDPLRGFRHRIGNAYRISLDADLLEPIYRRAVEATEAFVADVRAFTRFLDELEP